MGAAPLSLPSNDQRWLHGVNGWGDGVTGQRHDPARASTWGTGWSSGGVGGGGYGGYGWGGQGMAAVEGNGLYAKSGNGQFDSYSYSGYAPAFPYGGYSYSGGNALVAGGHVPAAAKGPMAPATANVVPVNYAYGGYGGTGNNPTGEQTSPSGSYGFPNSGIGYGYGNYQANAPGPFLGAFGGANPYNWDRSTPPEPPAWPHWGPWSGEHAAYGNHYSPQFPYALPYAAVPPYAAAPDAGPGSFAGYGLPASNGYVGAGGLVADGTYLTSSRLTGGSNHYVR